MGSGFEGTRKPALDSTLWCWTACKGGEEEEEGGTKGGGEAVTGSCEVCRVVVSLSRGLHARARAALVAEVSGVAGRGGILVRSASCVCEGPMERPGPVLSASHTVHLEPSQLADSRGRGRGASAAHTGTALESGERPSNTAAVVMGDVRSTTEFS